MGQGQRSHWSRSYKDPKQRQVGSHQRQVASFKCCKHYTPTGLESEPVEWKIKPRSKYGHASQTSQASQEGLNVPRLKKSSMNAFKQSEQDLR